MSVVHRFNIARRQQRAGLTLIELMVALAAAMILLTAVISVLGMITKGVSDSRATIEVTNRMRSAQLLLRSDLAGATCPTLVWQRREMGNGYFEIIEGPNDENTNGSTSLTGDTDDVLMFTTRAIAGQPFVGKSGNTTITSDKAEVVWYLSKPRTYADGTKVYNLYRRIFLIVNNVPAMTPLMALSYQTCDITHRPNPAGAGRVACTLGDLSNRRYRVFHDTANFPHALLATYSGTEYAGMCLNGAREGEDIVLSDVLSFDVKVFDPTAFISNGQSNTAALPGDVGYSATTGTKCGTFVNLGRGAGTQFGGNMEAKSRLTGTLRYYDTWSFQYENDNTNQDNDAVTDEYVNGLDDDNTNGIDDAGERETMPPYPYPLRGIQIKLRVYEPSSKLIREVTIEETFVP